MFRPLRYLVPVCITAIVAVSVLSCDDSSGDSEDGFDRSAMLGYYADNIIVPAYNDLLTAVNTLQSATNAFTSDPSELTLQSAQEAWKSAYERWQYANAYNFGPAGEEGLQKGLIEEVGTFPVSESKIENAIASGTYNLQDFNRDARGFLTVEYLLFNLDNNNAAIVDAHQSAGRKKYLTDLVADIRSRVEAVATAWSGSYKAEFISNDGTDVGSSTSQLYNEFVRSYESIKNFKIALPLGLRAGQTQPEPAKVEAYYSGESVRMFKAHLDAIEDIWYGRTKDGSDGTGFREYLEVVEGGPALIESTEAQLSAIHTALDNVPLTPRFSEQLISNKTALETLYTELQKNTRYFKSDMSSRLGIAITFASGDGD